jgi:hypothetical protein
MEENFRRKRPLEKPKLRRKNYAKKEIGMIGPKSF